MLLKSLTVQGFKSFADKTNFEFSGGVSAIVGPNGSGKSNVVDAIRWVLGEQSAKTLRGGKMEDVIFSGSSSRKPVGMARVTLTLDNSGRLFPYDYDEVAITRTLYRSGESHYALNGKDCRLKDILELFMDTGLGKDGFSVIGQGKIDEILTLHAEERRGLLEEAAGISKYKYRKREAQRRLETTEDDMDRLNDMLFELEQRVAPLQKQADDVRAYRAIEAEEQALSLAWTVHRIEEAQREESLAAQEKQRLEERLWEATAQSDVAQAESAACREKVAAMEAEDERLSGEVVALLERREEAARARALAEERTKHVAQRQEETAHACRHMAEHFEQVQKGVAQTQAQHDSALQKLEATRKEATQLEQAVMEARATQSGQSEALAALSGRQFDLMRQQADARNSWTRLTGRLDHLKEALARHEQEVAEAQKERSEWQRAHQALLENLAEKEEGEKNLQKAIHEKQGLLAEQKEAREKQHSMWQGHEAARLKAASRLDALNELEAGGQGYYAGVQAVLRAKERGALSGIIGTVSQQLTFAEVHTRALESALGGAAQHVMTQDDSAAQAAIAYLKKERAGKATFLPLNTVRPRERTQLPQDEAVIGPALDLVTYDPRYEAVMSQLLAHIVVVRDLASAVRLSKKGGFRLRMVTLDGDVVNPGGSLSGGRQKNDQSVMTRANERQRLAEEVARLAAEAAEAQERAEAAKERETAHQEALQRFLEEQQSFALSLQEVRLSLEKSRETDARLKRLEVLHKSQDRTFVEEKEEIEKALAADKERLEALAAAYARTEAEKKEREEAQDHVADEDLARESDFQRIREILAQQSESLNHHRRRLEEAMAQQLAAKRDLEEQQARETAFLQEAQQLVEERAAALAEEEAAQKAHQRVQAALSENRAALKKAREEDARLSAETGDCLARKNQAEHALEKAQEKEARLLAQIRQWQEELYQQFALRLEEAARACDRSLSLAGAVQKIAALRQKRLSYGSLNFTAPEEYDEVKSRVDFLSQQLADLSGAKSRLSTIIREMEKTMTERFAQTYEKVNARFNDIFQKMFGGGHAALVLSLPEKLLETGVDIVCQPPGKKERTLTLLSGGERAMTAIALLFALLEVRPSPFVILDEIEAALDGANVDRFAQFIGNYAEKTQFIVISHRQGTMQAADVLYGVTMDRDGVSRLVSVRIDDYLSDSDEE